MGLRELDNVMRRINRIRPENAADEAVLGVLKERVLKFADIGEYEFLSDIPKKVIQGDKSAIAAWKKANAEMGPYLSIQQGTKGAKRLLRNVIEDQDMTGVDLAKMTFGISRIAEGKKAAGVSQTLKEVFGEDSDSYRAYKDGILSLLVQGPPKTAAKKIERFVNENPELAMSIFSKNELKKLNELADAKQAAAVFEKNKSGTGTTGSRDLSNMVIGYVLGNAPGAAIAAAAGRINRYSPLNQAIAAGLEGSRNAVSREFGDEVGGTGAALGGSELINKSVDKARDMLIDSVRGAQ
jgi:hypothetical protein